MLAYLQSQFSDCMTWKTPEAGLSVWIEGKPGFDLDDWIQRARSKGVWMEKGSHFTLNNRPLAGTRMGFGAVDEREMEAIFDRLATL